MFNLKFFVCITCLVFFFSCIDIGSESQSKLGEAKSLYEQNCSVCHGNTGEGGQYPIPLKNVTNVKSTNLAYLQTTITKGRGAMPAFNYNDSQLNAVIDYILQFTK